MWQTKYALAVPKILGVGVVFRAVQGRQIPHRVSIFSGGRYHEKLFYLSTVYCYSHFQKHVFGSTFIQVHLIKNAPLGNYLTPICSTLNR